MIFREKKEESKEESQRKVVMALQVYIKLADIERYGLTRACKKCDHERNYGPGTTSAGHSKLCRDRTMNEMSKTPEGRIRIAAAAERPDFTVSELGQQHRADVPQAEITRSVEQHQPERDCTTYTRA